MDQAQRQFIDRLGQSAESDGFSPIAGRLFAVLLLSDEPRSLDELAESLGVSKASVSTDARRLLEKGIVERVTRAGDRRDFYELAPDFFVRIVQSRIERWRRMQTLAADLRAASKKLPRRVRDHLDSIDEVQSFITDRFEQALEEWQQNAPRNAPATRTNT